MATNPEFILQQGKGSFATYVAITPKSHFLNFPLAKLAQQPHMTADEQAAMREALRARYAVPLGDIQQSAARPASPSADEPQEFADRY